MLDFFDALGGRVCTVQTVTEARDDAPDTPSSALAGWINVVLLHFTSHGMTLGDNAWQMWWTALPRSTKTAAAVEQLWCGQRRHDPHEP